MIFPTKQSYRDAWGKAFTVDPSVPLNIDIELASICNLACNFCYYGESEWNEMMKQPAADGKSKKRFMPTELALRLIDEAATMAVPALKFNWRGESTLHPDYSDILWYAKYRTKHPGVTSILSPFHDIIVNTNANCKAHAIDGLMASTKCCISLDSARPETYPKMRVNGRLERAIEVVKELIRRGHPNLWIRRVVAGINQHEDFKADVDAIFGGKGYKVSEHAVIDRSKDSSHAINNPENYERTYCGYPSQRIMVASDGTCYPCCPDTDGSMPMGDVTKQSLADIWNGPSFRNLRAELRLDVFKSEICKKCESWMAYKSPQRDMVQDKAI